MAFGLALTLAVLIGVSLGALGSGGAIVTLPVLVYVARIPAQSAVGMSMAIVGGTSLFGSYLYYRRGDFHRQATILFAVTGMLGAYLGSDLTHLVPTTVLMLLFAGLMLVVGVLMLGSRPENSQGPGTCRPVRCLAMGASVGLLTGFLGVGGGFLIVPALVLFAGIELPKAVGSSLAIIALNSASGLVGQLRHAEMNWGLTALFLALSLAGMLMGVAQSGRISADALRRAFAWSVIVVAIAISVVNLPGLSALVSEGVL